MNGTQNLTKPVAAKTDANAPLSNRRDWKYFNEKLAELRVNDVENIIARGRLLIEAKEELEPGSFEAVVERHFDLSYARKLRIIAAHPIISHRSHANALPPSPETLYLLTTLPAALLREKLADGSSINPRLERKDVAQWRKAARGEVTVDGTTIKRKPSLTEKLKAAEAEVEGLKAKLAGKDDGSLFDLKNDSVQHIAEVIAANISEGKAADLARAIPEAVKQLKRKRQRPAG
jgi:hypothetical protein